MRHLLTMFLLVFVPTCTVNWPAPVVAGGMERWTSSRQVDEMSDKVLVFATSGWDTVEVYPWKAEAQIQVGHSCKTGYTWVGISTEGATPNVDYVNGEWMGLFEFRFDKGNSFKQISKTPGIADGWHSFPDGHLLLLPELKEHSRVLIRTETVIAGTVTWEFHLNGSSAAIDSLAGRCGN